VLGLRFASPAEFGETWKLVPGKDTSSASLGAVIALTRRLHKVAVVCGICPP
jgi:3-hydroxyacyl-CoA dehydrogenase